MYNNLSQQAPYYYGYGMQMPQYSRPVAPQEPTTPNYIKGRPVVSIDEARASQIDLDGSLHVFPDVGNKRIYTKQFNLDGTATFNVFELAPSAPQSAEGQSEYVTRDQLDQILNEFKASLNLSKSPKPAPALKI